MAKPDRASQRGCAALYLRNCNRRSRCESINEFRFKRSSSAGAYLGLTPRRYESGEVSRNGRISKHSNKMTRKHLYEAAATLLTRNIGFSALKAWGLRLAKKVGFKKLASPSQENSPSSFTPCGKPTPPSVGVQTP